MYLQASQKKAEGEEGLDSFLDVSLVRPQVQGSSSKTFSVSLNFLVTNDVVTGKNAFELLLCYLCACVKVVNIE